MKNLAQQKRVFNACLFTLAMWIIFAILFIALFFNAFFPSLTYFGLSNFVYTQEAAAGDIQKGDLVFYKKGDPTPDKLLAYYVNVRDSEGIASKAVMSKIFIRTEAIEEITIVDEEEITNEVLYYVIKTPGTEDEIFAKLADNEILGSYLFSIPKVGYGITYLNYSLLVGILAVAALALLLVFLPVMLIVKRRRLNKLPSPFKEGIELTKLSKENYYIYKELQHFFTNAHMRFEKGNDCVKIYIPAGNSHKILFATIVHANKTIRVLINRDFKRSDSRLDRTAFITIHNAVELPDVKAKINSIYKEFFKPTVQKMHESSF